MKARCKHRGQPSALSSRLARRVTQLKQKAAAQCGAPPAAMLHCGGAPGAEETPKSACREGGKGGDRGSIYPYTCLSLLGSTTKLNSPPGVDPLDSRLDWAAGQAVKRKRGRKPKVLMGVDPNRAHHKDSRASDKQEVREEKSDSDSSEHGELQYRSHTRVFSICTPIRLSAKQLAYAINTILCPFIEPFL